MNEKDIKKGTIFIDKYNQRLYIYDIKQGEAQMVMFSSDNVCGILPGKYARTGISWDGYWKGCKIIK